MKLVHKLFAWAITLVVVYTGASLVFPPADSADGALAEDAAFGIASLAGLSLFFLALLHEQKGENAKPYALVGSSISLTATIAYTGVALASTDTELAAVRWLAMVLSAVVAFSTMIAAVVAGIRSLQIFVQEWQDPSGQQAEVSMRGHIRLYSCAHPCKRSLFRTRQAFRNNDDIA